MFVDACAIVAILSDEREANRIGNALHDANAPMFTSPVAVLEVVLALARPDKFNRAVTAIEPIVMEFLDNQNIEIRDLPPASETTHFALSAASRFRVGRNGLNLADCLHYACAKQYRVPILATDQEFRNTDLEVVD